MKLAIGYQFSKNTAITSKGYKYDRQTKSLNKQKYLDWMESAAEARPKALVKNYSTCQEHCCCTTMSPVLVLNPHRAFSERAQ
jgi:hypothetical protein